jgi:hypothetical protein
MKINPPDTTMQKNVALLSFRKPSYPARNDPEASSHFAGDNKNNNWTSSIIRN